MSELKIGTVVRLKSGGPRMTCTEVDNNKGTAYCEWFGDDQKVTASSFLIEALEVVKPMTAEESKKIWEKHKEPS